MKSNRSQGKKRKRRDSNDRKDLARPQRPGPSQSTHPHQIVSLAGDPEMSRSQEQYPQAQPGSFFQYSSGVAVSGGSFTSDSSRNQHTNVTIVVNQPSETKAKIQSMPPHPSCSTPSPLLSEPQELPQRGYYDRNKTGDLHSEILQEEHRADTLQIPIRRPSLPVQKSSAIYYRHLASKGRGSPLWIPEPSINLPIEYQRKGIDIGDVGILMDHGSFHFLFNICTPAGDPINPEEMPEGFHPLPKPKSWDVDEHIEFKSNSYLASSLVETLQHDEDSVGLVFESSASEGAILTMPNGSRSRDLVNVAHFRKYAYANAEEWYRYANEVRGRRARNGDLRLVVGYNSSSAWGMATFANLSTSSESSTDKRSASRLKFKPTKQSASGRTYGWECSGMAEAKTGPDAAEVERLRTGGERVRAEGIEGDPNLTYENQCLFVRTLNVTLQADIWKKLSVEWAGLYSVDDPWPASSQNSQSFFSNGHSTTSSSSRLADSADHFEEDFEEDSERQDYNIKISSSPASTESDPQQAFSPRTSHPKNKIVHHSSLPTPGPHDFHPSKMINEFLLRERPTLKVAITEDRDWISVLNIDEQVLPAPDIICKRVMMTHDMSEEEGAVFLQPGNTTSDNGTERQSGPSLSKEQLPHETSRMAVEAKFREVGKIPQAPEWQTRRPISLNELAGGTAAVDSDDEFSSSDDSESD